MNTTVAVVGTGFIGTSIALALRARGVVTYLRDRNPTAVRIAEALGAGSGNAPAGKVGVAVLAVPPSEVAPVLAALQGSNFARFYTDVASVKALPRREMAALHCDLTTVVAGHPLANGERSGPLAARADLFEFRPWVLVPGQETSAAALNAVLELVAICGATPVLMDADSHDRAMALVSHGPHVISSLAAARLMDGDRVALGLAGAEARDVMRSAAGNPTLWADVLSANAGPLAQVLEAFATDVLHFADELRRLAADGQTVRTAAGTDWTTLVEALRRGAEGWASISDGHGSPERALTLLEVYPEESPRELARLFAEVAAAGVGIEEVELAPPAGASPGRVRISVARGLAYDLAAELRLKGWLVHQEVKVPAVSPIVASAATEP